MIVSKLKFDFADAPWSMVNEARNRANQLLEAVAMRERTMEPAQERDLPTLSELLYRALVEPAELVS